MKKFLFLYRGHETITQEIMDAWSHSFSKLPIFSDYRAMAYPATQPTHNISLVILRITILFLFINNYLAKRILLILTSTSFHRASGRTLSL